MRRWSAGITYPNSIWKLGKVLLNNLHSTFDILRKNNESSVKRRRRKKGGEHSFIKIKEKVITVKFKSLKSDALSALKALPKQRARIASSFFGRSRRRRASFRHWSSFKPLEDVKANSVVLNVKIYICQRIYAEKHTVKTALCKGYAANKDDDERRPRWHRFAFYLPYPSLESIGNVVWSAFSCLQCCK